MVKHILFPIDLQHTKESEKALQVAIDEARRAKARLSVMTVTAGFVMPIVASYFDADMVKKILVEVGEHLNAYIAENIPDDIDVTAIVAEGSPATLILKQAEKDDVDLIVISSHNSQIEHLLLGSCTEKVTRHSHCSVMVVK